MYRDRDQHAGQVEDAVDDAPSAVCISVPSGALLKASGKLIRNVSLKRLTTYPDQPTATVAAPNAYSRIRSQPMIQATNSPSVP